MLGFEAEGRIKVCVKFHKSSGMKLSWGLIRLPAFVFAGFWDFPMRDPPPFKSERHYQSFALNEASDVNTTIIVES